MNEADTALASILDDCLTEDDLAHHIFKHAIIVQHLVGRLGHSAHTTETAIRTLYAAWAEMAVEHLKDPGALPGSKYH
jgi:hypothetical protein